MADNATFIVCPLKIVIDNRSVNLPVSLKKAVTLRIVDSLAFSSPEDGSAVQMILCLFCFKCTSISLFYYFYDFFLYKYEKLTAVALNFAEIGESFVRFKSKLCFCKSLASPQFSCNGSTETTGPLPWQLISQHLIDDSNPRANKLLINNWSSIKTKTKI